MHRSDVNRATVCCLRTERHVCTVHLLCIVFGFVPHVCTLIAPDNIAPQIARNSGKKIIYMVQNSPSQISDTTTSGHAALSVIQHRDTAFRAAYLALTPKIFILMHMMV